MSVRQTLMNRYPLTAQHVMIRTERAPSPAGCTDSNDLPLVETYADLSERDLRDAACDPRVAAVAGLMPTTLIRPKAGVAGALPQSQVPWGLAAIGAMDSDLTGAGVTLAMLDTGIDTSHAAFARTMILPRDFSLTGPQDMQGHGTFCAGTIFGDAIAGRRIGVAPGVSLALIAKVLDNAGGGNSGSLFHAMRWAWRGGAHVVFVPLALDFQGLVALYLQRDWTVERAAHQALVTLRDNQHAWSRLIGLLDRATGPSGSAVIVVPAVQRITPKSLAGADVRSGLPTDTPGVVSVTALQWTSHGLQPAGFSNTAPTLAAPGVDIISAQAGGGEVCMSGNTAASAHVAGAACLWWQALRARSGATVSAADVAKQLTIAARRAPLGAECNPANAGSGLTTVPEGETDDHLFNPPGRADPYAAGIFL